MDTAAQRSPRTVAEHPGAPVAHASGMMTFPTVNPFSAAGVPLSSTISFSATPTALVVEVPLGVVVLALACGAVLLLGRRGRRRTARAVTEPRCGTGSLATGGAHR